MSNRMTSTEYNEVKNNAYEVISFKNGIRVSGYSNLNIKNAVDEMMKMQINGCNCYIIPYVVEDGHYISAWSIAEDKGNYPNHRITEKDFQVFISNYFA